MQVQLSAITFVTKKRGSAIGILKGGGVILTITANNQQILVFITCQCTTALDIGGPHKTGPQFQWTWGMLQLRQAGEKRKMTWTAVEKTGFRGEYFSQGKHFGL